MNKSQMVNRIAHNHKITKREASRVVTTFCDGISSSLQRPAFGATFLNDKATFEFKSEKVANEFRQLNQAAA